MTTSAKINLRTKVLVFTLFSLVISAFLLQYSTNKTSLCLDIMCTKIDTHHSLEDLKKYNQNFETEFQLKDKFFEESNNNTLAKISIGSLIIQHESANTFIVAIPMRFGSSTYFPVTVPRNKHSQLVQIKVFDSKEFLVLVNGDLVYSHRYLTPVFYIDPIFKINDQNSAGDLKALIDVHRIILTYNIISHHSKRTLALVIFLIVILTSIYFKRIIMKFIPLHAVKIKSIVWPQILYLYWIASLAVWIFGTRDDTGSQHPSPYGPIGAAFSDMFQIFQAGKFHHPYEYSAVNYPPMALGLIRLIPGASEGVLVMVITIISLSLLWWLSSGIEFSQTRFGHAGKLFIFILPYPVTFSVVRGNLDLLAALLVALTVLSMDKGYVKSASIFFAIAISLKIWPVIFIFYFLKKKKYSMVLLATAIAALLTSLSFDLLGYSDLRTQTKLLLQNLGYLNGQPQPNNFIYSYSFEALVFVLALIGKTLLGSQENSQTITSSINFLSSTSYLVILLALIVWLLIILFKAKHNHSIFIICSGIALLTSTLSYTYRGSILVVALLLRVQQTGHISRLYLMSDDTLKHNRLYGFLKFIEMLAWAGILAPTTFFYAPGTLLSTSSVVQPLSIIYLLWVEAYCNKLENNDRNIISVE